jgi:hypothetical protein
MESAVLGQPVAATDGRRFTPWEVLASGWTTWSRNAATLLAVALLLHAPIVLTGFLRGYTPQKGEAVRRLLFTFIDAVMELAAVGAIALGGLRAARREPLRVWGLVVLGVQHTWLTFKALFLSMWLALLIALASVVLIWIVAHKLTSGAEVQHWLFMGAFALASIAASVWFYPVVPLALSHPELGARDAVRQARELTRGTRPRLLAVALAYECLDFPSAVFYHWAFRLPMGADKAWALAGHGVLSAVLASFTILGPAVVCGALWREKGGSAADLDGLASVFN